jgi:hypothetical protein
MRRGFEQTTTTRRPGFVVAHQRRVPIVMGSRQQQRGVLTPLIVTRWPGSQDALVIAVLDADLMRALRAGFATWHSEDMTIPYHDDARLESRHDVTTLWVDEIPIATGPALPEGEAVCMVGIVEAGRLTHPAIFAEEFLDLLESSHARIAEVDVI